MEASELLMCVDVKMDTREKLNNYLYLRTWTKFFLKVESVRCYPCHLRISMIHHNAEISTNMTIRINVPGINVQMISSRKKQHICSLSWTCNQRNTIFLSFDSKVTCEKHVKWLRMAIEDLEQYSLQLITSRLNRSSTTEDVTPKPTIYENIWESRGMRSYDSQRCPSGIYEEIPDAKTRKSVASGIYEEMLPVDTGTKEEDPMPPPLPSRTRIKTYENQNPRSFTNPESEVLKKKRYRAMLDSILCLGKRRLKKDSPASLKSKFLSLDIAQGKRNSFSSPNLTKITRGVSESDAMTQYQCGASLSDKFWCHESYLNTVSSQPETKIQFAEDEQTPSQVEVEEVELRQSQVKDYSVNGAKTPEGYLEMGPLGFDRDKVKELDTLESQKKPNLSGYVGMNGSGFSQEAVQELDRLEVTANVEPVTLPLPEEPRRRVNTFDEKIPSYFPNKMVREGKRRYQKSLEVSRQANGEIQVAKRRPKPRREQDPSPEKSPDSPRSSIDHWEMRHSVSDQQVLPES